MYHIPIQRRTKEHTIKLWSRFSNSNRTTSNLREKKNNRLRRAILDGWKISTRENQRCQMKSSFIVVHCSIYYFSFLLPFLLVPLLLPSSFLLFSCYVVSVFMQKKLVDCYLLKRREQLGKAVFAKESHVSPLYTIGYVIIILGLSFFSIFLLVQKPKMWNKMEGCQC